MTLTVALVILFATVAGAIGYGRLSRRSASVADWAVGSRGFGTVLFWFMNAGEVYTTFAVLGISGYAYAMGAPAYLAFCSVSLSYAIGYWLMPKIWRAGRKSGLITQGDFFAARFGAPWLGVVAGVVGIAALVVYVQIQLVSLGLIVQLTIGGSISNTLAVILAAVMMLAFVLLAGLRSAAFAAGVKDVLMIVVIVLLSVTIASRVGAASILDIFHIAERQHPGIGKFPGIDPHATTTSIWLMSSALNVALGNWIFPHLFQISYAAGTSRSIRRNAIWQPLYSLAYFFIVLLGFAALIGGIKVGNPNSALLALVSQRYAPWIVGLVAGTGFLLALAPGSVLLLTAGSTFARNVVRPFKPDLSQRAVLALSRVSMVAFAAIAVYLTLGNSASLVTILLDAYSAIGMLAPAVFLSFLWRRVTAYGVVAGIVVGFVALLAPFAKHWWASGLPQWEPGLLAMAIDFAVTVLVSLVTPAPALAAQRVGLALSAADAQLDATSDAQRHGDGSSTPTPIPTGEIA